MKTLAQIAIAVGAGVLLEIPAAGQDFVFHDASASRGIGAYDGLPGMSAGAAAADFDNDGDIDIFVPTDCNKPNRLLRNNGAGMFEDVAQEFCVDSDLPSRGAVWFDYDGDHDLDLLVLHDSWNGCPTRPLSLFRQEDIDCFTDVTVQSLLQGGDVVLGSQAGGVCVGDVNNDGFLDLCYTHWNNTVWLLVNDGSRFVDISVSSNISSSNIHPWQPVMYDFNGDGWLDIFVAMDFHKNHLWINQGDETFIDMAEQAGLDYAWNEMGVTLCDYDLDGRMDMYVTNIDYRPTLNQHNALFRNISTEEDGVLFEEVSNEMGVDAGSWGWGATFMDADLDGRVDIAATNGFLNVGEQYEFDESVLFWNRGEQAKGEQFVNVGSDVGFADTFIATGLMAFDSDRDGDLDLLQVCNEHALRLLENKPPSRRGSSSSASNRYLTIKPRQDGNNHFAIGATVKVTVDGVTQSRLITAGISHLAQEPAEAHFGVGEADFVDQITVCWPDGGQTTLGSTATNQMLLVERPDEEPDCPGDLNDDRKINVADLLAVINNWGSDNQAGDANDDGQVNVGDLLIVINNWGNLCF